MDNDEYKNEKTVTAKDVLETIAGFVICFFLVTAALAAIWGHRYLLKLSLTFILLDLVVCCLYWWISNKIEELKK